MTLVKVALLKSSPSYDREYSYLLPSEQKVSEGSRVVVPFGSGNTTRMGVVLEVTETAEASNLKYILKVVDQEPLLNSEGLFLLKALKSTTFCTYGEAYSCQVPLKKDIIDQKQTCVRLTEKEIDRKLTEKQQEAYDFLENNGFATIKEIGYFTGVGVSVVKKLESFGLAEEFIRIIPRKIKDDDIKTTAKPIELNSKQQESYEKLKDLKGEALLYGVTGSGKTSVYMKLIEKVLKEGKQALVLIPEISLTPQATELFIARFGKQVAVLHSGLSLTEKLDEWNRIKLKKANIVVGTRSAIFAPLENIGLIVIDEEQERTYFSERSPRYSALEIAKIRANYHKALMLRCSATPSIESYFRAKNGQITLCCLKNRYTSQGLPDVRTIDLRSCEMERGSSIFSAELAEEIREKLDRHEQSILLLNRRGYNTLVKCSSCHETAKCPSCEIPLTYHTANNRLVCHYCGYSVPSNISCPSCKSKMLRYTGFGTQKAEEELKILFPEARVLRLDADTTISRFSYSEKFTAFANGEYDIIIGTQMIAKGLDFPNVTLVGVLNADQSLNAEDYHAYERTFSMVTQVVGRCGRAEKPGLALIQTYCPESDVLSWAAQQDYDNFAEEELSVRKVCLYPPYCNMLSIVFASENEKETQENSQKFLHSFSKFFSEYKDIPVRVLGPGQANPYKVAGRYRTQILVKCRNDRTFRKIISDVIADCKLYPSMDFNF